MKLIQKLSWLASAAGLALTAHAVPTQYLTGTIDFSFASGAVAPVNSVGTAVTVGLATGFDFSPNSPLNNGTVSASTGVLGTAIAATQQVSFSDFQFNPLGPSSPTGVLIWTHSGTGITFKMTSVSNITQNTGVLQVTGAGILSDGVNAYLDTSGSFTIFAAGSGSNFSFTSANGAGYGVPDGANLLVLVGSAMAGLVGLRRFRVKA